MLIHESHKAAIFKIPINLFLHITAIRNKLGVNEFPVQSSSSQEKIKKTKNKEPQVLENSLQIHFHNPYQ